MGILSSYNRVYLDYESSLRYYVTMIDKIHKEVVAKERLIMSLQSKEDGLRLISASETEDTETVKLLINNGVCIRAQDIVLE